MAVNESISVLVGATIGPLQKGLKKAAGLVGDFSKKAGSMVAGAGGIGGAITAAVGGISVAAGIKMALTSFMELEDASAKLTAALRGNGNQAGLSTQQVVGFASQLQKTTGIATATTMAAAAGLAKFQQIKGPNFTETIKQSANLAAVLGKDVVGATEMVGQALSDPRNGYLELAAAGVQFSDTQIDAIQAMQEAGDMAGAQGVILEALKAQYDGAAEAAGDTLSGKLSILKGSFDEVVAVIGAALAPAMEGAIDMVTRFIQGLDLVAVANKAWEYVAKAVGFVADVVQTLGLAWKACQVVMDLLILGAVSGFKLVAKGVAAVIDGMAALGIVSGETAGGMQSFIKDVEGFEKALAENTIKDAEDLQKAWNKPWDSTKTDGFFAGIQGKSKTAAIDMAKSFKGAGDKMASAVKPVQNEMKQLTKLQIEAQQEATKLGIDLEKQLKYHGLEGYEAKARELQDKGATKGQVDKVRGLGAQLKGKDLALELETPFEKFSREMEKLTNLQKDGGVDSTTFERKQAALVKDLQSAIPENKIQAGGALQAGGQEARSALLSYRNAGRTNNPQEALKKIQEQALVEQKEARKYLKKIADGNKTPASPFDS